MLDVLNRKDLFTVKSSDCRIFCLGYKLLRVNKQKHFESVSSVYSTAKLLYTVYKTVASGNRKEMKPSGVTRVGDTRGGN